MERANLSKDSRKYGGKSLKELQAAVDEDRASRALEEQVRIEVFHEIEKEERRKLSREYTESEFYAYDRENWGRGWSTQPGEEDQRTKGGVGIDRPKEQQMVNEKERIYFRVTQWDAGKQRGQMVDRQNCDYHIDQTSLAPECEGQVAVGDLVSGTVKDFETIVDILIEQGSNPISERREFSGVGPYSEAAGGWDPHRGQPQKFGTPDTGDSRTRGRK